MLVCSVATSKLQDHSAHLEWLAAWGLSRVCQHLAAMKQHRGAGCLLQTRARWVHTCVAAAGRRLHRPCTSTTAAPPLLAAAASHLHCVSKPEPHRLLRMHTPDSSCFYQVNQRRAPRIDAAWLAGKCKHAETCMGREQPAPKPDGLGRWLPAPCCKSTYRLTSTMSVYIEAVWSTCAQQFWQSGQVASASAEGHLTSASLSVSSLCSLLPVMLPLACNFCVELWESPRLNRVAAPRNAATGFAIGVDTCSTGEDRASSTHHTSQTSQQLRAAAVDCGRVQTAAEARSAAKLAYDTDATLSNCGAVDPGCLRSRHVVSCRSTNTIESILVDR